MNKNEFIFSIIGGIIIGVVVNTINDYFIPFISIGHYSVILWILIPIIFIGILLLIFKFFISKSSRFGAVAISSGRRPPERVDIEGEIEEFNVLWRVQIGRSRLVDDAYAYAEGPFCPKCEYELDSKEEKNIWGKSNPYWFCHPCNKKYPRDKKSLYDENKIVEKIAEKDYRTGKAK